MKLSTLLTSAVSLLSAVLALPIDKRLYQPSSPVFSVIAHHEGAVFQYHLLKFDGQDLVLNTDEKAFFGRVQGSHNYTLNLPGSEKGDNATQTAPDTINVVVDPKSQRLTTTKLPINATTGFGIEHQKLTYKNESAFLACPSPGYRGEYYVYFGNHNKTECPPESFSRGYTVELIVESDSTVNYNPDTNKNTDGIPEPRKRSLLEYLMG